MTIKRISRAAVALSSDIRRFSRSQEKLWQQIPFLALQADGRSGHSEQYSRAYGYGFWALRSSESGGYFTVYVDLENGDLVNPHDLARQASIQDVLRLATTIEELDAKALIKKLEKEAGEKTWEGYDKEKKEAWRNDLFKKLNLKPKTYKRDKSKEQISKETRFSFVDDM